MADKIRLLPDTVANQIAAGEVVNRPASVVKEMVENAVDAGAHNIAVSYRNGGKESLKVVDDGEGMSPVDARLAFDKHATSKICTLEDVYSLNTFGFRGEALASIAAIASVELLTRKAEDELGTKIIIEGSRFQSQEVAVCGVGSQFTVKNLFYNVPARRRALDKSTTEPRHIAEEFRRVALAHTDVGFALYGEDAPIYNLPASSLKQRIVGLVGKNMASSLLETGTDTSLVKITGFVGHPSSARMTNRDQYLFVNGRFFKSGYFHKAILKAYDKLIPSTTQPSYFLYLEVDPQKIDVNIHPQKIEVNFEDGIAIWQILHAAVREALAKTGAVSFMDFDQDKSIEIPVSPREGAVGRVPASTTNPDFNPFSPSYGLRSSARLSDFVKPYETFPEVDERELLIERFDESVLEFIEGDSHEQGSLIDGEGTKRFNGSLLLSGGYIATTLAGKLVLVDLQRAKEAILHERYMLMLGNESSVSQRLLFPEVMVFSADDVSLLEANRDDFAAFGFDYILRDANTMELTGIPADFSIADVQSLIYDMIDAVREQTLAPDDLRRRYLAGILSRDGAKHISGSFTQGEIEAILGSLSDGTRYAFTSDGRAVMVTIMPDEIKGFFTR